MQQENLTVLLVSMKIQLIMSVINALCKTAFPATARIKFVKVVLRGIFLEVRLHNACNALVPAKLVLTRLLNVYFVLTRILEFTFFIKLFIAFMNKFLKKIFFKFFFL
jgi:hypothetical protein